MKIAALCLGIAGLIGMVGGTSAATLYSNDFSSNSNGFAGAGSVIMAPSGEKFLGPLTNGGAATLMLSGVTPNSTLNLSFFLYAVGSTDGNGQFGGGPDPFRVVGPTGDIVFDYNFANFPGNTQSYPIDPSPATTGASTINALQYSGFPGGPVQDSEYQFNLSFNSGSSSDASIVFIGLTNEGLDNEFYGIDNVVVSGTPLAPAGAPAPLAGAGLLSFFGAGGVAIRKRAKRVICSLLSRRMATA